MDLTTIVVALIAFLVITVFKVDVAKVALGAMTGGILYAVAKGLWPNS
jgi:zinc transporter ZupT